MTEQPKLYEMTMEEILEYLNSTKPQSKSVSSTEKKKEDELPQSKSVSSTEKKKEDELPQYFYDICTNLFIC